MPIILAQALSDLYLNSRYRRSVKTPPRLIKLLLQTPKTPPTKSLSNMCRCRLTVHQGHQTLFANAQNYYGSLVRYVSLSIHDTGRSNYPQPSLNYCCKSPRLSQKPCLMCVHLESWCRRVTAATSPHQTITGEAQDSHGSLV